MFGRPKVETEAGHQPVVQTAMIGHDKHHHNEEHHHDHKEGEHKHHQEENAYWEENPGVTNCPAAEGGPHVPDHKQLEKEPYWEGQNEELNAHPEGSSGPQHKDDQYWEGKNEEDPAPVHCEPAPSGAPYALPSDNSQHEIHNTDQEKPYWS